MARTQLRDGWPNVSDEELLDVRMSDLPLAIEETLAGRIAQLRAELDARGLNFPLHFYLSDEWFTPDGATAIAIPFYLAHPRLEKLEEPRCSRSKAASTSGACASSGTKPATPSTTRFACAAAVTGSTRSDPRASRIPSSTRRSRTARASCCISIRGTRKAIPDEDFAETFAVWLTPNSEWRQRYAGWRALSASSNTWTA